MREKTTNLPGSIAFLMFGLKDYNELMEILLTAGCQIEVFSGKIIDFEKIAILNPGLILFDFDSTQPNLLDVILKLKEIPCLTETPVLFVSDTCDDQMAEFVFQLGSADLICRPFQKSEVLFRIKKHFTHPVTHSPEIGQFGIITGEKQAEKALLASDVRFRRIVESSPIGKQLYQLNEKDELILLRANPSADAILGLDHRSLFGKTIQQAFPKLVETDITDRFRRIAKGELDMQHFEIKDSSDQIDQHFEVTAFRIAEKTIAVDFIDISPRKQSEQNLQESEEKYRLLFENNPQAMWIYDSESLTILDVNNAAVSLYGFSKEEFLSMTLIDLLPGKVTGELQAYLPLIPMGLNKSGIWPHQKKTGDLIDLEIISHQIVYQGRPARLVSSSDVTERVKAEMALLESEERFRTTLYSIGDGVITTDARGKVQMMNTIAEKLTGWSQEEAEGRMLEEVFPIINEDTRRPVEAPVRKVIREGATVGLANHTVLIGKSGIECPIADSAAPIRNKKGEILGVVLVFRDQTRERDAERTLQESEFFFRESQKAAKIGSFKLDISTGFWTSSEVLDEIFGIDQDFIRSIENWGSLIHPDDLPILDRHLNIDVIQKKQPFNIEYRIFRKSDNALRWVHDTGQLIFDKIGAVKFVIGTTQDITERKNAEKSIESKNRRLNAIIQAMPDLMFISDREGNYLEFFNPKSVDVFYPQDKIIGANVSDVLDAPTARLHIQKIQECLDKKELISYEFSAKEDGEPVHFEGRMVPLDENRVLRVVRNITESKKLQQEQFRLLNIIESSLNEISVFDPETFRFSYVNRCGLSNLGYSLDEMKNLTLVDITVGYDWNTFAELIEPLTSGQKQKLVFETVHKRNDGTTYPVEVHLQLHFQDKGKMFFVVVNDITHRKLAEASLRESEEMFRKLAESSPMLIGIFQDDRWVYTNPATEKLGGYNEEEYKQMFVWNLAAPEFQSIVKKYASLQPEGLQPETGYEFRIIRKNGESRWVYLKGSRISYKGRPAGLISGLDMTDKKEMEDELRLSEERFRKAIIEAPFPIMLHTDDDEVMAVSRGWTDISGYDAGEITTTSEWVKKVYGQESPDIKSLIDRLYSINHWIDEGVYPITTKQGEQRYWDFGSSPLGKLADGRRLVISMAKDVTDRIRSIETVQNERTLLRTLIDNLPDLIYVKDSAGRKLLANKADLENIGVESEAEVIGKTDFELFDTKTAEPLWNDDQKVLKQGLSIINKEEIYHRGEKGQHWFLTSKVPLRNQQGEIIGLVGIGHDITSRRLAAETIQKLSKGIEQSPSSVVITDVRGIIEYANPRFSEATGYRQEEVIGQMLRMLKPGKMSPEQLEELRRTINSGETWRGEFINRRKNKTKYLESVVVSPVIDEQKRITNILIISEDITLRKQEEKLRDVIQSITHDGSVAKDLIDFTSKVKKRLEELIDLTNFYLALYDEGSDMFWIPAYYDQCDDIETFAADKTITAYVLRSKKSLLADYDDICKLKDSGSIETLGVPAQVWLGVPLLVGEKAIGVLAVQSYDNPLLYNEQDKLLLERVAHEISYIIQRIKSEEEIKLALEKAEESDKPKSAFLANMSHEIRTPLNSIIGFSELLADEAFEAEQKDEFIQHIVENGNQLLKIISDILDISKIESGEIIIRKTELQAKKLLGEIRSLHILKVEGKLLHFRFTYPEDITEITILADRERLHQVFNNLISNALKFTTEGYIEVGCSVQERMLEFYVKDTGIGIALQNHSIIFDRFRQVDVSMTRKFGGNGLGLAITKNLVELMGGKIWLESEPGKGSTFFFTVPLVSG